MGEKNNKWKFKNQDRHTPNSKNITKENKSNLKKNETEENPKALARNLIDSLSEKVTSNSDYGFPINAKIVLQTHIFLT